MSPPTLTLIAAETSMDAARALLDRVEAAWCFRSSPPHWRVLPLSSGVDVAALSDAIAILIDDHASDADTLRLIDALEAAQRPAALLLDCEPPRAAWFAGRGLVASPIDVPEPALAGLIHALVEGQGAIEAARAELGAAARRQGGVDEQMRRMHEELQLAASVQRELLPRALPECENIEFGVLFRPCSYVSGDIYSIARLDETHVGFFLADAVGHGVPAALMTVALCHGLAMSETMSGAKTRIVPPAEAMSRLNATMIDSGSPRHRFATAIYGVIDTATRRLTLTGAGHPPPLLVGPNGSVELVESEGGLLGVFPEAQYDEVTLTLRPAETLIIFSDGFETAFPDAAADQRLATKRYEEHFLELARARRDRGAEWAIEELARALDEQSGSLHQVDDLTALIVGAAKTGATRTPPAAERAGAA